MAAIPTDIVVCKADGKVAVSDETQSLLNKTVVKVTEVSVDEHNDECFASRVAPIQANEHGFTFMTMSLRLFFPFFLYCLAVGAVAAPKVTIILAMMCRKALPNSLRGRIQNNDMCAIPSVHVEMSHFMVYANLISGVLCAICGPQLCRWSDRYGRRPLIAVSVMGMLLGDLVSVFAAAFPDKVPVYWILIEFIIGGLTGAFLTTMSLVQSYIADVTSQQQRTAAFGILHACMYLGLGLGPGAGAFFMQFAGHGDMSSIFCAAGICHFLFVLYVLFLIPESLSRETRRAKALQIMKLATDAAEPSRYRAFNIFRPLLLFGRSEQEENGHCTSTLRTLAGIDFLAFGVQVGLPPLLVVYSQLRFDWKTVEASLFLSLTNTTRGFVLAVILPLGMWLMRSIPTAKTQQGVTVDRDGNNTHALGHSSYMHIILISILLDLLGQIGFAVSRTPVYFIVSGAVAATGAPICPVTQSLMTFYVDPSRWGELFGALSLLHSVARACIPMVIQIVYGLTVQYASSVIFWILSVLFGGALLVALRIGPRD